MRSAQQSGACDVFAARLSGADAAQSIDLFDSVRANAPESLRLLVTERVERAVVVRLERGVHRIVHEPCDADEFALLVDRSLRLREIVADKQVRAVVGGIESIPRPPLSMLAIEKVLADPEADVYAVAAVVGRDAALAARLLRLVNSSFFGVSRPVSRIDAAVSFLGLTLVRALAVAESVVRTFPVSPEVLDIEDWNAHAVRVAAAAREIVSEVRPYDRALADEAFLAGLVHDVGHVVLAGIAPDEWIATELRARSLGISCVEAEAQDEGVAHAHVGAYLLNMWGLPASIVDAVAFHHESPTGTSHLDASLAVHIADALIKRTGLRSPPLDLGRAQRAGITDAHLADWTTRFGRAEQPA